MNKTIQENIIKLISMLSSARMLDYEFHRDDDFEIIFTFFLISEACESYGEKYNRYK